ncbi:hypothetical protein DIPPA_70150 [Diplonema papillatum]|nr:hypothetical protein DIPPA_70150 [Diplonema papillatum]
MNIFWRATKEKALKSSAKAAPKRPGRPPKDRHRSPRKHPSTARPPTTESAAVKAAGAAFTSLLWSSNSKVELTPNSRSTPRMPDRIRPTTFDEDSSPTGIYRCTFTDLVVTQIIGHACACCREREYPVRYCGISSLVRCHIRDGVVRKTGSLQEKVARYLQDTALHVPSPWKEGTRGPTSREIFSESRGLVNLKFSNLDLWRAIPLFWGRPRPYVQHAERTDFSALIFLVSCCCLSTTATLEG